MRLLTTPRRASAKQQLKHSARPRRMLPVLVSFVFLSSIFLTFSLLRCRRLCGHVHLYILTCVLYTSFSFSLSPLSFPPPSPFRFLSSASPPHTQQASDFVSTNNGTDHVEADNKADQKINGTSFSRAPSASTFLTTYFPRSSRIALHKAFAHHRLH